MKTQESKLKDKIKEFLKAEGAYYFMPVQMGYGAPSVDFLVCYRGKFIALETKAPGKRPTPRQELTMRAMACAGALTWWGDDYGSFVEWWNAYIA